MFSLTFTGIGHWLRSKSALSPWTEPMPGVRLCTRGLDRGRSYVFAVDIEETRYALMLRRGSTLVRYFGINIASGKRIAKTRIVDVSDMSDKLGDIAQYLLEKVNGSGAPAGAFNSRAELVDVADLLAAGDYAKALRILRPLALQGDAISQYDLGLMYAKGHGVPKDPTQAVMWWQKAAAQGIASAQFHLGKIYFTGAQGVPKSLDDSLMWFRRAAAQGDQMAQDFLGKVYSEFQGKPGSYAEAVARYREAAALGDADAQYYIGQMYAIGEGVPQDYTQAAEWLRKAADQGMAQAQFALGWAYYKGEGVPLDSTQAVSLWRKAADQGVVVAKEKLAGAYALGNGVPQDFILAYALSRPSPRPDGDQRNPKAEHFRQTLVKHMTPEDIKAADVIATKMERIGLVTALDEYLGSGKQCFIRK